MALSSTIYKAMLNISNLDRNDYREHQLTLARHPSETEERLMVRLVAYILFAQEGMNFADALSNEDEPDLWLKDLTGSVSLWIDVGMPSERSIRKACGRAGQVLVVTYGGTRAGYWWKENRELLLKCRNLTVLNLPEATTRALETWASRSMAFSCTLEAGQLWLINDEDTLAVEPVVLQRAEQGGLEFY